MKRLTVINKRDKGRLMSGGYRIKRGTHNTRQGLMMLLYILRGALLYNGNAHFLKVLCVCFNPLVCPLYSLSLSHSAMRRKMASG